MAKAFNSLGEHLLKGRLNLTSAQIGTIALQAAAPINASDWRQKTWLSQIGGSYTSTIVPKVVVVGSVTTDVTTGATKFVVPDIVMSNGFPYPEIITTLVFFVDTGNPNTSPLIGYDDIGTTTFTENFQYVYKSSSDGLIQIEL